MGSDLPVIVGCVLEGQAFCLIFLEDGQVYTHLFYCYTAFMDGGCGTWVDEKLEHAISRLKFHGFVLEKVEIPA